MTSRQFNWLILIMSGFLIFGTALLLRDFLNGKPRVSYGDFDVGPELTTWSAFTPNQKDDWGVSFFVPDGMKEDETAAGKAGVFKVFRSIDGRKVHPESVIVISFLRKTDNRGLNEFVTAYFSHLRSLYPAGRPEVGLLRLNPKVVKKFEDMRLPYASVLFTFDDEGGGEAYNSALFFFETPAGRWMIDWRAPRKIITRDGGERELFLLLIRFLTISIINPETKGMEIHM